MLPGSGSVARYLEIDGASRLIVTHPDVPFGVRLTYIRLSGEEIDCLRRDTLSSQLLTARAGLRSKTAHIAHPLTPARHP